MNLHRLATPLIRRLLLAGLLSFARLNAALPLPDLPPRPATISPFRMGFSATALTHVNESDGRIAIDNFVREICLRYDVPLSPFPPIYKSVEQLRAAFTAQELDAVVLSTPELWFLRPDFSPTDLCVAHYDQQLDDRFVLLVDRDSPIKSVKDLAGRSVAVASSIRTILAPVWLDVELARVGLPPAADYVGRITEHVRPNLPALDVFFGRADACLVCESIQETIYKLNPALRERLRAIAFSPRLVSTVAAFLNPPETFAQAVAIRETVRLHETASGRQVLLLMRIGKVTREPMSVLDSTFALLDEHRQRCPGASQALESQLGQSGPSPARRTRP